MKQFFAGKPLSRHTLPCRDSTHLDVAVKVGNELVLLVAHACPEVGDAQISLLAVPQVRLGDEDVAHGQHAQAPNLLGRVEDDRREA